MSLAQFEIISRSSGLRRSSKLTISAVHASGPKSSNSRATFSRATSVTCGSELMNELFLVLRLRYLAQNYANGAKRQVNIQSFSPPMRGGRVWQTRNDRAEPHEGLRLYGKVYGFIVMRFSTLVTPGAKNATLSASSRSAQERTEPLSVTTPPSVSTVIRAASSSALRRKASSIFR